MSDTSRMVGALPVGAVEDSVRHALAEDLGRAGDITTNSVVPVDAMLSGTISAREAGRIAGVDLAVASFRQLDRGIKIEVQKGDGSDVLPGDPLFILNGNARAILTAERTALNFLGHLSGIATATHRLVQAVEGTAAQICCTRKTTPGMRVFEKHAVRMGGGVNHRFGLDDAVLIKDNHLAMAGGVRQAVEAARANVGHMVRIEVEVDTLEQLNEALEVGVEIILLDNMSPETLREAVKRNENRAVLEASGGITLETVRLVADAGVDLISVGWITHSAACLDLGLDHSPLSL
ncbi:MAG: nicotinate-nucleotide diphosphorylase (carboxylating) [Deltaproteobacteria bacterium]|nr:nicotinate-nucleotide diphosphorylase (carboxylating) [Deltaproteobacteria bacterium]